MRRLLATAIILIAIGIIGLIVTNFYLFDPDQPGAVRAPRGPGGAFRGFTSNGEQIYFTGTSSRGVITATGGPFWFQMHDGGCVVCHGPAGRGGRVTMMTESFEAPNITYRALTNEEHDGDHRPYTDPLIKRAITRGLDSDGEALSNNMPRWQMTDEELNDVIEFLKTLDR